MEAWQKGLSAGLIFGVFALVTMLPLPFPDPRQKRQAIDALAEQIREPVADLAELAVIDERGREPRDQAEAAIRRLEQHRAAIRAGVRDVELGRQRSVEEIWEQQTRCRGRVAHVEGLRPWRKVPEQALSITRRPSSSLRFTNSPG